jgi:hypothetical protein
MKRWRSPAWAASERVKVTAASRAGSLMTFS